MNQFELNIVGDIPAGLDLEPGKKVVAVLMEQNPPWLSQGVINLKLVDDKAIQALNKDYSGNDYPTDVLSFSYVGGRVLGNRQQVTVKSLQPTVNGQSSDVEPIELGDMVISLETAKRQADEAGTSLGEELATLVLHGILHIFGFDHGEDEQRRAMDLLQADILANAKVNYRNFNWV